MSRRSCKLQLRCRQVNCFLGNEPNLEGLRRGITHAASCRSTLRSPALASGGDRSYATVLGLGYVFSSRANYIQTSNFATAWNWRIIGSLEIIRPSFSQRSSSGFHFSAPQPCPKIISTSKLQKLQQNSSRTQVGGELCAFGH